MHDSDREDDVNLPNLTNEDLRDRADRASARLDALFGLSTLVFDEQLDADNPVVAAALGLVHARIGELIQDASADAAFARAAAVRGAVDDTPGAEHPSPETGDADRAGRTEDDVTAPRLTRGDLRGRTLRLSARRDAVYRLQDLIRAQERETTDPVMLAALDLLYERSCEDLDRLARVSARAWDAYLATPSEDAAPTGERAEPDDPSAALDPDLPADELARVLGMDPADPSLDEPDDLADERTR